MDDGTWIWRVEKKKNTIYLEIHKMEVSGENTVHRKRISDKWSEII